MRCRDVRAALLRAWWYSMTDDVLNASLLGAAFEPRAAERVQRPGRLLDRQLRIFPPGADPVCSAANNSTSWHRVMCRISPL